MSYLGMYVKAKTKFSNKVVEGIVIEEAEHSEVYLIEDVNEECHYSEEVLEVLSVPFDSPINKIIAKRYLVQTC